MCATTSQWSFHLISITTPDSTGLSIHYPNLTSHHQISPIYKKEKETSFEKWLLQGVLQKSFHKNFTKFREKYLCYSIFLILLRTFRVSGLQLDWRETPALVFQNQLLIDHLQYRCSSIIKKIQRKTPMLESLFKQSFQVEIHRCSSK